MSRPTVIDCHAPLSQSHFSEKARGLNEVLARCAQNGVAAIVFSLSFRRGQVEHPLEPIEHAGVSTGCSARVTLGVDPPLDAEGAAEASRDMPAYLAEARRLAKTGRIVAVGECGLDYYWPAVGYLGANGVTDRADVARELAARAPEILAQPSVQHCIAAQKEVFSQCVSLAAELGLPLVVHGRNAYADIYSCLDQGALPPNRVMLHCFGGTPAEAREGAQRGHWVSFPSSVGHRESFTRSAAVVPIEQMLIETDSPYHAPWPGYWKRAGQLARDAAPPSGTGKTASQKWRADHRRSLFVERFVEPLAGGLSYSVHGDADESESMSAGEYLLPAARHRTNEPTYVRAAAEMIADLKGRNRAEVCAVTTRNARTLFAM